MLVTEQVDAMRAMGTDPSRKLVTPRVMASILMLPLLTALNDFVGLLGGCVASVFSLRLGAVEFWNRAINALEFADIMQGMTKPMVYGFIFATIGCYRGLTVRGGTQGVGRATTQAVVVSSVMIIAADVFLTKLVDQVVRNCLAPVRERLKPMEELCSGVRPCAMLASQCLACQVRQHSADAAPLSPGSFLNRAENVIIH